VSPENAHTAANDDWTLVDPDGFLLARILNRGCDDGTGSGSWRWRVYGRDGSSQGGSAIDGKEARIICERVCRSADT
jgi:hypothetical protein